MVTIDSEAFVREAGFSWSCTAGGSKPWDLDTREEMGVSKGKLVVLVGTETSDLVSFDFTVVTEREEMKADCGSFSGAGERLFETVWASELLERVAKSLGSSYMVGKRKADGVGGSFKSGSGGKVDDVEWRLVDTVVGFTRQDPVAVIELRRDDAVVLSSLNSTLPLNSPLVDETSPLTTTSLRAALFSCSEDLDPLGGAATI